MITEKDIIGLGFTKKVKFSGDFYIPGFSMNCEPDEIPEEEGEPSIISITYPNETGHFVIKHFVTCNADTIALDPETFAPQTIFDGYAETIEELKMIIKCLRLERFMKE